MTLRIASLCAVLVVSAGANSFAQEDEAPPELKLLNFRSGEWTTETTIKPGVWFPKGLKDTGKEKVAWILGGRFQQSKAVHASGLENTTLMGYDPAAKVFRGWYFDSGGIATASTGTYDAAKKTFAWKSTETDEFPARGRWRIIDEDTYEWDHVIRNKAGEVMMEIEGRLKRKK